MSDVRNVTDIRSVGRPKQDGRPRFLQSLCTCRAHPAVLYVGRPKYIGRPKLSDVGRPKYVGRPKAGQWKGLDDFNDLIFGSLKYLFEQIVNTNPLIPS